MPSWLEDYVEYSKSVCEAPLIFHKWAGLWVLASAIGRQVYIKLFDKEWYPNLFICLVGPSARVQKSTTGDIGVNYLDTITGIDIVRDRMTRAYLVGMLHEKSTTVGEASCTIYAPELRTALSETTLKEGIMEFMTRLYDCPPVHDASTRGDGQRSLLNCCMSFLGCSTPEWLTTGLRRDEIAGGFAGRVICVYGDTPHIRFYPHEESPPAAQQARIRALNRLKQIVRLRGQLKMSSEMKELLYALRNEQDTADVDARIKTYYDRKHEHAVKLSMLFSVSENDRMVITGRNFNDALNLLAETEPHMLQALKYSTASNRNDAQERVYELIVAASEHGGISRSDLGRAMNKSAYRLSSSELSVILTSLVDFGFIYEMELRERASKRPKRMYFVKPIVEEVKNEKPSSLPHEHDE